MVGQSLSATVGQGFYASTSVFGSHNGFAFYMENLYTGNAVNPQIGGGYNGGSAEAVVERPTIDGTLSNLSNFRDVYFSRNDANGFGVNDAFSSFANKDIEMYDAGGTLMAGPDPVSLGGNGSFTDHQDSCR